MVNKFIVHCNGVVMYLGDLLYDIVIVHTFLFYEGIYVGTIALFHRLKIRVSPSPLWRRTRHYFFYSREREKI